MPAEEIQHLYEILDQKQVEEQVFEGLHRLLGALEEQIIFYEELLLDPGEYRDRPRDEKISLFGSDTTIGQILDSRANTHWESKQQLHEARSMLAALALPPNYDLLGLDSHVRDAFYAIDNLLEGFWLRRDNLIAAYEAETAASRTPTQ